MEELSTTSQVTMDTYNGSGGLCPHGYAGGKYDVCPQCKRMLVSAIGQNGRVECIITATSQEDAERQFKQKSQSRCFRKFCEVTGKKAWTDFTFKEI